MVARSIEMPAIFELDAGWSVYYVHCTWCIALKLALTTCKGKCRLGPDCQRVFDKFLREYHKL